MLRIAICDDEKYDRDRIQALLLEYLETHNLNASIDLFSSGKEFLSERDNLVKYDIVSRRLRRCAAFSLILVLYL